MSTSIEMQNQSELAKAQVLKSDFMSDDMKKNLLGVISIAAEATNGLSPEEKIQKMTESVFGLAINEVYFFEQINRNIVETIRETNVEQCSKCKAMAHVLQVEKEEEIKRHIDEYKKKAGIKDDGTKVSSGGDDQTWKQFVMAVLQKPYFWIFASILVFSPHGAQMLDTVLKFVGK